MNIDEMNKKLDIIVNEDIETYFNERDIYNKILHNRCDQLHILIASLSQDELHKQLLNFFIWEKNYEEELYSNNIQGVSNIYKLIELLFINKGQENEIEFEDFLTKSYTYKDYTLNVYCGQGCFSRIYYNNNNQIFQTT